MTQEELDALLGGDTQEAGLEAQEDSGGEKKEEKSGEKGEGFKVENDTNWPPPPPTSEHKVVHQLDDVTRDSEAKATETFDKLEIINNAGMDIEDSIKRIDAFLKAQQELLTKLHTKFPNFHTFEDHLAQLQDSQNSLSTIRTAAQQIGDTSLEAMDLMQYQDIHRQKIERVINVMRALARYMGSLFEGKIDDSKRVSSAVYIQGDNSEALNEDDIESLIANIGGK
ncbi:MAG: chemotaxis protein [Helicobacter sp.]|nr:chemotaxis protein [Helicobacter sp.]